MNSNERAARRAKGFAPEWTIGTTDASVRIAQLPPILRTLLVTDGTVTQCLEAYFWEPVSVEVIEQCSTPSDAEIEWLGVRAGEPVMRRRVDLVGRQSNSTYARCLSVLRLACIPESMGHALAAGEIGIGELIRARGLESYRELLHVGVTTEHAQLSAALAPSDGDVYRIYGIAIGGRPAIMVTESFCIAAIKRRPE